VNMYFFSVVNADSVQAGGTPAVVEMGPYAYQEVDDKNDTPEFSEDKKTVTFLNNKTYIFDPSLSCDNCTTADIITVPNLVLLTIADLVRAQNLSKVVAGAVAAILEITFKQTLFVSHSVDELMYKGYNDPLIDELEKFKWLIQKLAPSLIPTLNSLPKKIAFFYGKNGADDGLYKIVTGQGLDDLATYGEVLQWRNATLLPADWWSDDTARAIDGSDGSMYKPFLTMDDQPNIFITDICRSVHLNAIEKKTILDIPGLRFVLPPEIFDYSIERNHGFCNPADTSYFEAQNGSYCLPYGLMDVSRCQPGNPPIAVSFPHFLHADPEVQASVDGLRPDYDTHTTFVDLEPTSGLLLRASRKLQINVKVKQFEGFGALSTVKSVVIPACWLNETATLDTGAGSTQEMVYGLLVQTVGIVHLVCYLLMAVGSLILVSGLVGMLVLVYEKHTRAKPVSSNGAPLRSDSRANLTEASSEEYLNSAHVAVQT
jgi:lysosome membrane protein 2